VSHLTERKEKDCLNCGAVVHGRFCQVCGQENIEPKESFWHLVTHFMYDITHFDGKFFRTLKYLLFKPGFLSHEYLRGRRASYLHPIRMYVFTSAFFFLIFFSFSKGDEVVKITETPLTAKSVTKKLENRKGFLQGIIVDSAVPAAAKLAVQKNITTIDSNIALIKADSTNKNKIKNIDNDDQTSEGVNFLGPGDAKTEAAYDSAESRLPKEQRDGFIMRHFEIQKIHLKQKYHDNRKEIMTAILEKFKHLFPQMLFVSLPLFAMLLQLLYVRRKNFYYVNHVVFTIHLYCGTFIILLAEMATRGLFSIFNTSESGLLKGLFILLAFFYWYKSLRNFYEQGRAKTVLKYMLIMFLSIFIMAILFSAFFFFSAMTI